MIEQVLFTLRVALVCAGWLLALRWYLADRKAEREAVKVLPLVELEANIQKLETQVQAAAWRK